MNKAFFKFGALLSLPLGIYSALIPRFDSIKTDLTDFIGMDKLTHLHFLATVLYLWNMIALIYIYVSLKRKIYNPLNTLYSAALVFSLLACIILPLAELIILKPYLVDHTSTFSILFQASKWLGLISLTFAFRLGNKFIPNSYEKLTKILYFWFGSSLLGLCAYLASLKW